MIVTVSTANANMNRHLEHLHSLGRLGNAQFCSEFIDDYDTYTIKIDTQQCPLGYLSRVLLDYVALDREASIEQYGGFVIQDEEGRFIALVRSIAEMKASKELQLF